MTSNTHYLLENLKLQLDLHGRLISLQEKKRRAVVERDIGGLEAAVADEEDVVVKVKHLTEVRGAILEKLAQRFGLAPSDIKISKIVEKSLREDMREVFSKTLHDLSDTARKIVDLDTITVPKKEEKRPAARARAGKSRAVKVRLA